MWKNPFVKIKSRNELYWVHIFFILDQFIILKIHFFCLKKFYLNLNQSG